MAKERRLDFDYLRGIGIILVVMGHTQIPSFVGNTIYLFHLALFYFASGFFFSESITLPSLLKKKYLSLYLPWLKYGLCFLVLHNVFVYEHFYTMDTTFYSLREGVVHLIKVLCFIGSDDLLGPLWFLRSLFLCNLLFFCIVKTSKRLLYLCCVLIILIGVSYLFYHSDNHAIRLVVRELLSSTFLCVGYLYRRYECRFKFHWTYIIISFLCLLVLSAFGHVNMVNTDITSPLFFFVSGLCGIFFVLGISKHLARANDICKPLTIVGKYAIHILALHWVSFKLVSWAIVVIYGLNWSDLSKITISCGPWWIIYSVIGVILPMVIIGLLIKVRNVIMKY
jgi:fucose 4-O-acetylase-like acetyltransferase